MVARMSDQLGRVLGGRYRLAAAIGTGASAQVFLADDVTLRRRVAVKVLHPALATDESFLRRFRAEARAAAALSHPNLMAVYDWGEDDGPYLVLEYLGGGSLRGMLDRGNRLAPSQALLVGLDAARALDVAHRRGFVHRDIKPANLLFGEDGRLRIADFGLARALSEAGWTDPGDGLVGTARYAAPEQARGGRVDGKADVYALGLVLAESVTGTVPLTRANALETMMARVDTPVPVPDELGLLQPILVRVGSPEPVDRPDAAELGRTLVAAAREMERPAPLPLPGVDLVGADDDLGSFPDATAPGDDITVFGRSDATGVLPSMPAEAAAPPRRRRRRWPWFLLTVLVAAAVVAGGAVAWTQLQTPSATVPRLITLPVEEARAEIAAVDDADDEVAWRIDEKRQFDDNVPAGIVLDQQPGAGKSLDDGGTVTLIVSGGPRPVDLPDLHDASEEAAREAIEVALLKVGNVEQRYDEVVPAGKVVTWFVAGNERPAQAPKGSPVDVWVSAGPQPREIPDLTNVPEADARAELEKLGLEVARTEDFSDTIPAGRVVRTDPAKGQTAGRGDTVTIVVSKGPDLVTVPETSGMTAEQAAARLEAAGLTVDRVEGPFRGRVYTTDPPAGQRVKRGTSVDIYLRR